MDIETENDVICCAQCGAKDDVGFDAQQSMLYCKRCGGVIKENVIAQGSSNLQWDAKSGVQGVLVSANQTGGDIAKALIRVDKQAISTGRISSAWGTGASKKSAAGSDTNKVLLQNIAARLRLPEKAIHETKCLLNDIHLNYRQIMYSLNDIEIVTAACVYIACRQHMLPINIAQAADSINCDSHVLFQVFKDIQKELHLVLKPPNLAAFAGKGLYQICSDLGIRNVKHNPKLFQRLKRQAIAILKFMETRSIATGRATMPVVASALYMTLKCYNLHFNQSSFASVMGCTESTIMARVSEIKRAFLELKQYVFDHPEDIEIVLLRRRNKKPKGVKQIEDRCIGELIEKLQQEESVMLERENNSFRPVSDYMITVHTSTKALQKLLYSDPPCATDGMCNRRSIQREKKLAKVLNRVSKRSSLWKGCKENVEGAMPAANHPKCHQIVNDWVNRSHSALSDEDIQLVDIITNADKFEDIYRDGKPALEAAKGKEIILPDCKSMDEIDDEEIERECMKTKAEQQFALYQEGEH